MAYSTILLPEIMFVHNGTEFLNKTDKLVVDQDEGSWIGKSWIGNIKKSIIIMILFFFS